jgi:hypothetical protein
MDCSVRLLNVILEKGPAMADTKEVLVMMKDVAKTRIQMLKDGVTFHDTAKREYYLGEYERKLRDIEHLIRRLNIRLVYSCSERPHGDRPQ